MPEQFSKNKYQEKIDKAIELLKESQEKVKDRAKDVATDIDKTAKSNPWPFVGGAAVLGFLTGILVRIRGRCGR